MGWCSVGGKSCGEVVGQRWGYILVNKSEGLGEKGQRSKIFS